MKNMSPRGKFWDQDKFRKLTEILSSKGEQAWPSIVESLGMSKGVPHWYVKNARYGNKPYADEYEFDVRPTLRSNKVIVRSPFPDLSPGEFVEMPEETARKIIVLGVP